MGRDEFGNLLEWGGVVERIGSLRDTGELDEHQEGLARILRYRRNWRLRETVLEVVEEVKSPSMELVSGVWAVLADRMLYLEVRVLAARAPGEMLRNVRKTGGNAGVRIECETVEDMKRILDSSQAPVLHDAVRRALARIDEA